MAWRSILLLLAAVGATAMPIFTQSEVPCFATLSPTSPSQVADPVKACMSPTRRHQPHAAPGTGAAAVLEQPVARRLFEEQLDEQMESEVLQESYHIPIGKPVQHPWASKLKSPSLTTLKSPTIKSPLDIKAPLSASKPPRASSPPPAFFEEQMDEQMDEQMHDELEEDALAQDTAASSIASKAASIGDTLKGNAESFFCGVQGSTSKAQEAVMKCVAWLQDALLVARAWLELRLRTLLSSQPAHIAEFLKETLPNAVQRILPSKSTLKSVSELIALSASVWAEALGRILKLHFSILLHALWRQGLVIAHSFSRLSADNSLVPNTPVLERKRAELRAKSAAHDVKTFRARMEHLQGQMAEASARLRDAEDDAADAVRRLSNSRVCRGEGGVWNAGTVQHIHLSQTPKRERRPV